VKTNLKYKQHSCCCSYPAQEHIALRNRQVCVYLRATRSNTTTQHATTTQHNCAQGSNAKIPRWMPLWKRFDERVGVHVATTKKKISPDNITKYDMKSQPQKILKL